MRQKLSKHSKMDNEKNEDIQEVEEVKAEVEVMQKAYEFTPSGTCTFRQRGPYIVCTSCEIQHANWIGMDRIMVGEDEKGKPILKSRSEL